METSKVSDMSSEDEQVVNLFNSPEKPRKGQEKKAQNLDRTTKRRGNCDKFTRKRDSFSTFHVYLFSKQKVLLRS
jgi:hypothetical protein